MQKAAGIAAPGIAGLGAGNNCRVRIATLECPRSADLLESLPRAESGKLLKRLVKAQYREGGMGVAH